jgi:hypothetical protein
MHVRSTMSSPARGWTRGRIASLGGALGALLALAGCDSARVIVPMPADTHAAWTRLTGSALQDPFYPDWRAIRSSFP